MGCSLAGRLAIIARGLGSLERVAGSGYDRLYRYIIILGPISRVFLLRRDLISRLYGGNILVVPSSYDDVAIYVNLRRSGYSICRGDIMYRDLGIVCLERGEDLWGRIAYPHDGVFKLIFTEDLDPMDRSIFSISYRSNPGRDFILISHGVSQPSGLVLDIWPSIRIDPRCEALAMIDVGEARMDIDLEIIDKGIIYRLGASILKDYGSPVENIK
jgi:hypothetical protein